ncbi:kelch-like protein 23 isoform X2 [Arctopsyche grandis]|uniref:kelch-like protein 23 isoform X2 n=1 Tax=Arctopsyche grandis TaxID=121162 RepID=UPI00406D8572
MCDDKIYTKWLKTLMDIEKNCEIQKQDTLNKIRSNYMKIFRGGEYMHLSLETFKYLLDSDEINVQSEEIVFESVKKWMKCNETPKDDIHSLLKIVRYQHLSLKYIMNEVELFTSPIECSRGLVMDAIRWHVFPAERSEEIVAPRKFKYKLLSLGSFNSQTRKVIEEYDSFNNRWRRLKDMEINKRAFGVAFIDEKVVLIGGITSQVGTENAVDTVESIDLSTGAIQSMAPLNVKRYHCVTAVIGEDQYAVLYAIGGWGEKVAQLNSVERFDAISKTWSEVASMNVSRSGCCCAVLNGNIYVAGGRDGDSYVKTFEMYNVKANNWEMKEPFFDTNAYVGMTAANGFLYLIGGHVKYQEPISKVCRYDPKSNTWTKVADISSTGCVAAITIRNKPIYVGGLSPIMQEYDEENNKWNNLAPLNVAREGFVVEVPYYQNLNW